MGPLYYIYRDYYKRTEEYLTCDIVNNFFLARTKALLEHPWDERLKLAEHWDYFWTHKGSLKVALHRHVFVGHEHGGDQRYDRYRNRAKRYLQLFLIKHGLKERVLEFKLKVRLKSKSTKTKKTTKLKRLKKLKKLKKLTKLKKAQRTTKKGHKRSLAAKRLRRKLWGAHGRRSVRSRSNRRKSLRRKRVRRR